MDIQAVSPVIMIMSMIGIYSHHRETGYQIDTLPQDICKRRIVCVFIIRSKCEHRSLHRVHNVSGRCFHNDVPDEIRRETSLIDEHLPESLQFRNIRKFSEQKQISRLLKAEPAVIEEPMCKILYINTSIVEFTVNRNFPAVYELGGFDFRYLGKARNNSVPIDISEASLDIQSAIELSVDQYYEVFLSPQ